jgi:hypothetical protein
VLAHAARVIRERAFTQGHGRIVSRRAQQAEHDPVTTRRRLGHCARLEE